MTTTVTGPKQNKNGFDKAYSIRYYKEPKRQRGGDGDEAPPSQKPRLDGESSNAPGQAGAPCAMPWGCDLSKDYRCASKQTNSLDSPWGTFVCTLIPNVATAVASYVVLGGCRGRCLLGDINGTNLGDTNGTGYGETSIAPILQTDLVCPCNCTYVSSECCISSTGIVHESLEFKYNTTLRPQDGSVCCDDTTGQWTNSTELRANAAEDPTCPQDSFVALSYMHMRSNCISRLYRIAQ